MSFTCRNFMKIAPQFHIRLLNPQADLNRSISWLHYLEDPAYTSWLRGNELVLTTGMLLDNQPENYRKIIDDIYAKDAAGLIINLSPYIESIPEEVIAYANFLGFPLFEMPPESAIVEVSENVCRAIMENNSRQNKCASLLYSLLYDNPRINTSFIKKAEACGYRSDSAYYCLLFNLTYTPITSTLFDDAIDNDTLIDFENTVYSLFSPIDSEILSLHTRNQILWLLPANAKKTTFLKTKLSQHLLEYGQQKSIHIIVGISPLFENLEQFLPSYQKAFEALRTIPFSRPLRQILFYEDLDTLFLLLSKYPPAQKTALRLHTLSPLLEYDSENDTELVSTLQAFIQNNGVLQDTAAALYIHVNTLRYRLRKTEDILHCSLKDWQTIFSLMLDFRILSYLESEHYPPL